MAILELVSSALGYVIATVYLMTAALFLFVRITAAVGLMKEGKEQGGVWDFLKNFH